MACESNVDLVTRLQAEWDDAPDLSLLSGRRLELALLNRERIERELAAAKEQLAECLAGLDTPGKIGDVSLTCLIGALSPFIPGPLNVLPIGIIEDWLNYKRLLAKAAASNYNLAVAEFPLFDAWWSLSKPAAELHKTASLEVDAEIREAWVRLAGIVKDGTAYTELGYRHVRRVSGAGRFVIFSDHHMAFAGSRLDFFQTSGNMELYSDLLADYADTGFTLVENGDVEELIIHEPMLPAPTSGLEARVAWRHFQLSQVIEHHRTLYEQINTQFVEQDRYIRIAGNHDQDNQDERFLETLRSVYPKLEQVYDFLIIEPSGANNATFVVGHGHHFDTSSTPKYAPQIGELLSECLGWAYEGADRIWKWDGVDGVQRWANGGEPFLNDLVTDESEPWVLGADDVVALGAAVLASLAVAVGSGVWLLSPTGAVLAGLAVSLAAGLTDDLSTSAFWEEAFAGNIAWQYFQSDDPGVAVFNEALCGTRWFKFRHLDEVFINGQLESKFLSDVPYLVLGHSHEPRHRARNPATFKQADHYLNSGSAGRFGNLIWCVEIVDGVPQVVAWHRPGGPQSGEAPERRTYTPDVVGGTGILTASDSHVPLPPEEQPKWLEPVLHMMMSQPR